MAFWYCRVFDGQLLILPDVEGILTLLTKAFGSDHSLGNDISVSNLLFYLIGIGLNKVDNWGMSRIHNLMGLLALCELQQSACSDSARLLHVCRTLILEIWREVAGNGEYLGSCILFVAYHQGRISRPNSGLLVGSNWKRSRDHTGRWTSELIWSPVWQPLHPQPEFDLCLWLSHASRIHHHPDPWWMVSWSSIMLGLTVLMYFGFDGRVATGTLCSTSLGPLCFMLYASLAQGWNGYVMLQCCQGDGDEDIFRNNEAITGVESGQVFQPDNSGDGEDDKDLGKASEPRTLQFRTSTWPSSVNLELPSEKTPITETEKVEGLSSSQFWNCCSLEWIQKQAREVSRRGFKPTRFTTVASYFCTCLVIPTFVAINLGLHFYGCVQGPYEYSWSLWCWLLVQGLAWFVSFRVLVTADTLYQHFCLRMVLLFSFAGSLENILVTTNCLEGSETFCTFLQGLPCQAVSSMISFLYWSAANMLLWMLMLRVVRLEEVMHAHLCSRHVIKLVLCCIHWDT